MLDLFCQCLRIAARALPVFAMDNQCNEGEIFLDTKILTKSPFLNHLAPSQD